MRSEEEDPCSTSSPKSSTNLCEALTPPPCDWDCDEEEKLLALLSLLSPSLSSSRTDAAEAAAVASVARRREAGTGASRLVNSGRSHRMVHSFCSRGGKTMPLFFSRRRRSTAPKVWATKFLTTVSNLNKIVLAV